ncbi:MAG: hypothetical protein GQ542_06890 [Desulforhopalus sp.]|nr:hypothetical protein [Desulforhopalus sp.]
MKEISNRSAIIVTPKSPFNEWAELYNESSKEELENRLGEKHIYLIEWTYEEEFLDALKPYHSGIFEYELLSWNSYKHEWPKNRNYEIFQEWFNITLCDEIIDLEKANIKSEKL